jgi:hypothetical protein
MTYRGMCHLIGVLVLLYVAVGVALTGTQWVLPLIALAIVAMIYEPSGGDLE